MTTILLVDDDAMTRDACAKALVCEGYEVVESDDAAQAFVELDRRMPDLILTDINLPGVSGRAVLPLFRRKAPGVPVVAISGLPRDLIGDEFDDVFEKGDRLLVLLAKIQTALSKREP